MFIYGKRGLRSLSNRNEYQKILGVGVEGVGGKALPERKADNLTAICEPIV
jgi:hypothetical protein